MEKQELSCFVIGPIGDRLAELGTPERELYEKSIEVWEKVVLPACEQSGLKPLRADQISRSGEIVEQVCRHLRDSDIVIADVTGGNANVMYELGLRHTVNKVTIQIGESGRLPFDVAAIRTIQFSRSEAGLIDARKKLYEAIRTSLSDGTDPVAATRVWQDIESRLTGIEESVIEQGDDEPGFLEKLTEAETGIASMNSIIESITRTIKRIGEIAESAAEENTKSDAAGGGAGQKLAIAERTAKKLEEQGASLEALTKEFEACVQQAGPGVSYLIEKLSEEPESEVSRGFAQSIRDLAKAAEDNESVFESFREAMRGAGAASRSMRRASNRIINAIDRQQEAADHFKIWRDRL